MKLRVEYEAQVKKAAGVASEDLEIEDASTLSSVLQKITESRGDALHSMLLDSEGNLQKAILLFHGDRQIRWDESPEFSDGDVLTILSPISGG